MEKSEGYTIPLPVAEAADDLVNQLVGAIRSHMLIDGFEPGVSASRSFMADRGDYYEMKITSVDPEEFHRREANAGE